MDCNFDADERLQISRDERLQISGASLHDAVQEFTRLTTLASIVALPLSIHARADRCSHASCEKVDESPMVDIPQLEEVSSYGSQAQYTVYLNLEESMFALVLFCKNRSMMQGIQHNDGWIGMILDALSP